MKEFADQNLLKLNVSKCEIVVLLTKHSSSLPVCEVDGPIMHAGDVGKCLGYWWKGDLSASRSVEENIPKARWAFFHFRSIGAFQGDIRVTDALMERLESFQGELVKRVLKWPKHHSNTGDITTLLVPTMKSRVLVRKLGFLKRVISRDDDSLSGSVLLGLCGEVDLLCRVRECRELLEGFGTCFTKEVTGRNECCLREMKKVIFGIDRRMLLENCAEKAPLIAKVAEHLGWEKLWVQTLDVGGKAVLGLQMISRTMSHHGRGEHQCQLCRDVTALEDVTLLKHILATHH